MNIIKNIINRVRSRGCYVIADPADNSVTLSRRLFFHMKKASQSGDAKVFVFKIPAKGAFAFMLDPEIPQPTQLCQVQYNEKYRCVGFETLCPSVGHIFYTYHLPADKPVKLSVTIHRTPQGKTYYQLDQPSRQALAAQLTPHH